MSDSEFPVRQHDGLTVVTTADEIDIGNAGALREAMLIAARSRPPVLIVDMTGTEFCDSTGLNVLVRAQKQAQQDGREVRLAVRASAVRRILAVSGVGSMFQMYDSVADAVVADAEPQAASQDDGARSAGQAPADQA